MILVDNINYLRKYHRLIREQLKIVEEFRDNDIHVTSSKIGAPTLVIERDGKELYIHSKYDPLKEAEALVEKYVEEINDFQHLFFYGIGLGYHIEAFIKKFPKMNFSIYEPNINILYQYLCNRPMFELPNNRLKHFFVETETENVSIFLNRFTENISENVLFIALPSYERIFEENYKVFFEEFQKSLRLKRSGFHTNYSFQKLWIFNSFKNFPKVVKSSNVIYDVPKDTFFNKPAILVAAGPSLEEEIENLKEIKEKGLAYIFSIGSANKVLIANGIYPDAVTSYDPGLNNRLVFEEIRNKNIDSIPLIFGSSVGYSTIEDYPGKLLHMITSQDTVSKNFLRLNNGESVRTIQDAPSIAVLTMQLLAKLKCNPIILVGQNLAYKNNQHYASGISYQNRPTEMTDADQEGVLYTDDVNGKKVKTKIAWIQARKQIEYYISQINKVVTVYNTTKDGAKIEGTSYRELAELMDEELKTTVVNDIWHENCENNNYDTDYLEEKLKETEKEFERYLKLFKNVVVMLQRLQQLKDTNNVKDIERCIKQLDREYKVFKQNLIFKDYIAPVLRVELDIALKKINNNKFEKNINKKANTIVKELGNILKKCKENYELIIALFNETIEKIK